MNLFDFEDPWRLSHFAYPIGVLMMLLMILLMRTLTMKTLKFSTYAKILIN